MSSRAGRARAGSAFLDFCPMIDVPVTTGAVRTFRNFLWQPVRSPSHSRTSRPNTSVSSACRSTSASRAAAWTWAPRRCASPASKPSSRPSATKSRTCGNVPVALAETKSEGDPHAKYLKEITATCSKEAELVIKTLEDGAIPGRSGRRPLHCRRHRLGRGGVLSPQAPAYRLAVDRRPYRHQYARQLAQRQCARHAAGRHHGTVPIAAHRALRLQSQGAAAKLRAGRHPRRGQP